MSQLDSEGQQDLDSVCLQTATEPLGRKSREQLGRSRGACILPHPRPGMQPSLLLSPGRGGGGVAGGGSESWGPWIGLIPASRKSFPPGTCSESEHGVSGKRPLPVFCLPAPSPRLPCLQLQGALLPGHQEGVWELRISQLPHLLRNRREAVRTCPPPPGHCGVEGDGFCPGDNSDSWDRGRELVHHPPDPRQMHLRWACSTKAAQRAPGI